MSIYDYIDYRDAIRFLLKSRRQLDTSWTYQRLAEVMRIQKSYLSQVLNGGKAELSSDQLYLLIKHFALHSENAEYLSLLLEYSRSSIPARRAELKAKIVSIQNKNQTTEAYLKSQTVTAPTDSMNEYYLDSYNQLIHICLSHKKYLKDPLALAEPLGLKKERIQEILLELEHLKVISINNSGITVLKKNLHLPKTSKLTKSWKTQMRQMALQRSLQSGADENYNFSAIFSCKESVRKELQTKFFNYIQEAQQTVASSEPDHVYQLNFDLLSWV